MPPLLILELSNVLYYGDESDDEPMYTETLKDILDRSQSHPDVNRTDARYKIRDLIKQRKSEWKGALKTTQSMGKGSHRLFKTVIKEILQDLPPLGETGSEVSHFVPETRNFAEVPKFSEDIKKPWIKATLKKIKI